MNKEKQFDQFNLFQKRVINSLIIYCLIFIVFTFLFLESNIFSYLTLVEIIIISFCTSLVLFILFRIIISHEILTNLEKIIIVLTYSILIYMLIFNRHKFDQKIVETDFYLRRWLKIIFTNQVVFVNIVGNIILFIPLGFVLDVINIRSKWSLFVEGILVIFIIEFLQYVFKRGVFDVIDLFLNTIGLLLGLVLLKNRKKEKI